MTTHGPVLVVDDDDDLRDALQDALQSNGYTTLTARDGLEAQAVLQRGFEPRCILLDLRMPRMNGFEFLAWLRAKRPNSKIPIVLITAEPANANDVRLAGLSAVLRKPFDFDTLLEALVRYGS